MDKPTSDKLIFQYMNKIFGFALEKLRNIDQAQELASDIICEVYGSFLKADNIANIDGYVYRIARNVYARYIVNLQNGRRFISIDEMIPAPEIRNKHRSLKSEGDFTLHQRYVRIVKTAHGRFWLSVCCF